MFSDTLWNLGHWHTVGWLTGPLLCLKISISSTICVCLSLNCRFFAECLCWWSAKLARTCAVKHSQVFLGRSEWRQYRICKKYWLYFSRLLCFLCKTVPKSLASFRTSDFLAKIIFSACVLLGLNYLVQKSAENKLSFSSEFISRNLPKPVSGTWCVGKSSKTIDRKISSGKPKMPWDSFC